VEVATTPEAIVTPEPLVISWPKEVTPAEAIERALYALADIVSGVVGSNGDVWELTAYPKSERADRDAVGHRLREEVTDQSLRLRIAERTDPIRNLVFALAFSRSGLATADQPVGGTEA
jgi:His-Xaa-Ser system protein HxsD